MPGAPDFQCSRRVFYRPSVRVDQRLLEIALECHDVPDELIDQPPALVVTIRICQLGRAQDRGQREGLAEHPREPETRSAQIGAQDDLRGEPEEQAGE